MSVDALNVSPNNQNLNFFQGLDNWESKTSDKDYIKVRNALRAFTSSMQFSLMQEKDRYISEVNLINNRYSNELEQIRQNILDIPNEKAKNEFSEYIRSLNRQWDGSNGKKTITENNLTKYNFVFSKDGIVQSIISSFIASKDKDKLAHFQQETSNLRNLGSEVEGAMSDARDKASKLRDAKFRYNQKVFENAIEEQDLKHKNELEICENDHRNRVANIVNSYSVYFAQYFTTEKVNTSYVAANSLMRGATGFTCVSEVPKAMYFGKRTFSILSGEQDFFPEVINLFKDIKLSCITTTYNNIFITLPYCRTLEEGYSIFSECSDPNSENDKAFVKAYVMKILMNFPAGQTRPILLDNDSSSALTMFANIGESSGRGIVTRPWAREEDITSELKKVADERSNLSISYGDDVVSRLEREPVYFVAGRNFPKGFTYDALSQIANIFLAGSKNGFFGLIQANSEELNIKKSDHNWKSLIDTVQYNSLTLVKNTDNMYKVIDSNGQDDTLEFDMMNLAMVNSKEIISVIINGFSSYKRQVEKFEYLFSKDAGNIEKTDVNEINTWYRGDASSYFEIPIGISGASTVQKFHIDGVQQHGLISGVTGSGKSSLLRTMIVSTMMKYTPENVNMYLVDFKEGVEFEPFSRYRLPWIKVIALNTEREFALNILNDLDQEFKKRADMMKRYSATHISQLSNKKFPRLILIFDEVQELLRVNDGITDKCISILSKLVSEGRAMGINIILTSQDFTNCNGIDRLKANMVLRIAFKGSPASAKSIMGEEFSVAQLEQGDSGYAAINTASGAKGKTNFFQAGYLDEEKRDSLLSKFAMTMQNKECNTRVMSSNASQDRNNKFNRLICNEEVEYSNNPKEYDLMLGEAFNLGENKSMTILPKIGDNVIMVGENENVAKSIFSLSILSVLYDELSGKAHRIDNELVRIIDLSDEYEKNSDYFEFLETQFPHQIKRTTLSTMEDMIEDTYKNLIVRKHAVVDKKERLFLMFFGIDGAISLYQDMYEDSDDEDEVSLSTKLKKIIQDGPDYGINCIFWSRNLSRFKKIVDNITITKYMKKHLFFGDKQDDCDILIQKDITDSVKEGKAVMFKDMDNLNSSIFRPYEIPDRDWVEQIATTYKEFEKRLSNSKE